jgi:hypothetical protein
MNDLIAYFTALMFIVGTGKVINTQRLLHIPLINFVDLSNLITFVLNTLYDLILFGIGAALIFLFRKPLLSLVDQHKTYSIAIALIILFVFVILYKIFEDELFRIHHVVLRLIIFFVSSTFCLSFYTVVKEYDQTFFLAAFGIAFAYIYVKLITAHEIQILLRSSRARKSILKYKGGKEFKSSESDFVYGKLFDYIFLLNTKGKTWTAIPMSEVESLESPTVAWKGMHDTPDASPVPDHLTKI